MSKALSCSPAIQIELFIENTDFKPFFRVEIPSGSHKPYCTGSGSYKIREDGRNVPVLPEPLLKMFLEREGEEFEARFAIATRGIEERMASAADAVEELEGVISGRIEEIGSTLGWAEYKASDAADTIDVVLSKVHGIASEQQRLTDRVKALLQSTDSEDPVKFEVERQVLEVIKKQLKEDPALIEGLKKGDSFEMSLTGDGADELSKDDLTRLVAKAYEELVTGCAEGEADSP